MSVPLNIRKALEARIVAFVPVSPVQNAPIQWRAFGVEQPNSGPWIEVGFFGETSGFFDKGGSAKNRRGFVRLTCTQKGTEAKASANLTELAGQIEAWFPKGLVLTNSGVSVKISRDTQVTEEFWDAGRLKRPVLAYWQSIA